MKQASGDRKKKNCESKEENLYQVAECVRKFFKNKLGSIEHEIIQRKLVVQFTLQIVSLNFEKN